MLAADYSLVARSISELSAVGAPTRPRVLPLNLGYAALMAAFGVGASRAAGRRRLAGVAAGLIVGHAALSGVFVLPFAMGFGAAPFRGWFRVDSLATLAGCLALTAAGAAGGAGAAWEKPARGSVSSSGSWSTATCSGSSPSPSSSRVSRHRPATSPR